jgi:hypothetical protein
MSISAGPPSPPPDHFEDDPLGRQGWQSQPGQRGGAYPKHLDLPGDAPRIAIEPVPRERRISLIGWGIGALVSIALWVVIIYLVTRSR